MNRFGIGLVGLVSMLSGLLQDFDACERCCGPKISALNPATPLDGIDYYELRRFFLSLESMPPRLRSILEQSTLETFNSVHARMIYQQMLKSSDFDGGFRMKFPLASFGTVEIREDKTKLNISVIDIRLLKEVLGENSAVQVKPLDYGERPKDRRQAYEMVSSFIFALFRISFEVARYYPSLKKIVISALSVQILPREGEKTKYFLLRLLEDRLGFERVVETHPGAKDSVVYQLGIDLRSTSGFDFRISGERPTLYIEGEGDILKNEGVELLRQIRDGH